MEAEDSMDLMEQKVHELDARLKQMKEERDQVVADNEELAEQLNMANTFASVGNQRINEVKAEVSKLAAELQRMEYNMTTQEHELKSLGDHMCDLNSLKETVKDHSEEIVIIKDDYAKMKSHLTVAAKLELQTQERVYESRLHHLESVLEEMRQREGHFLHLAQETAALKDQVDALRELSTMMLRDEYSHQRSSSFPPSSALVLESPVRSQSNISFKSEDNNLEKEILANEALTMTMQQLKEDDNLQQQNKSTEELEVSLPEGKEKPAEDADAESAKSSNLSLNKAKESTQLMQISNSPKSSIKVSGTLKLMTPFEVQKSYKKFNEDEDLDIGGCFPKFLAAIWTTIFD